MAESDRSLDILGAKPLAEAANTVTTAAAAGAGAFLSRICLPAAEEFGLLLRDKVSAWRARNAEAIAERAAIIFEELPNSAARHAHPRIVGGILENGSWADDEDVRGMWAGLLATSCTESGRSQENLIFMNLLAQLTTSQARIISFACTNAEKYKSETGLLLTQDFYPTIEQIIEASGIRDLHVLDLEVDHLREIGLLDMQSGLSPAKIQPCRLTPSAIALQLHVRCNGHVGSPTDYFNL
ncbi:hypothetical protein [Hydrogenophaga sp.]|uniref:Abi-alpha family protein n=1 Tax=Hydrogenophaga sp. TaxID=1904254 RepID=UPI0027231A0F|nr:hypothetical protein [Hydrogenophaga sp.]MDO9253482.1 hypothetical protein [Hydrogenophaga sp.]MDP3322741.1 hypothetical protein [Hydrogenophaga sp.]MDP3884567.1 hypothetical protein [Hydrogenophaga sp.]